MRFSSLGSGSRGNATLVESGSTCLMIDCGFSCVETEKRLARLNTRPSDLAAILVTHEHADHIGGVERFAVKHAIPVYATAGTLASRQTNGNWDATPICSHRPFQIGDLEVHPFPVPHDAREPCQFVFHDGRIRLGLLTDTGSLTRYTVDMLSGVDGLVLECNHDTGMLADGPYPARLKQRVGGQYGHLSNQQAADLLSRIDTSRLQCLVGAHLSDKNNHPDLARQALACQIDEATMHIAIACQERGFGWQVLHAA